MKRRFVLYAVGIIFVCLVAGFVLYLELVYEKPVSVWEDDYYSVNNEIETEPNMKNEYNEFQEYMNNSYCLMYLEIESPSEIILPVLDIHGCSIHYKTNFTVSIYNPCNVSTYLKTNISYYRPVFGIRYPNGLYNDYFNICYPTPFIMLEPFETKEYNFSIEIYGSGTNQIFLPKSYYMIIFIQSHYRTSFPLTITFEDIGDMMDKKDLALKYIDEIGATKDFQLYCDNYYLGIKTL